MSPETMILIPAGVIGTLLAFIVIAQRFLYICRPNEILIFSGKKKKGGDGTGFRVETGHGWKTPILEQVERMDVSLISVPMQVNGAYSKGGIPLSVQAFANVKVSSERRLVNNAIERFLGRGRAEIARVAKETLEGHLRGVLATMTPEQVNEDRLEFAKRLSDEADPDLEKLGLDMDTLKVQHVADDRNYLESIGRRLLAEILRDAEVAEANAEREAREAEAASRARAEVAMSNAQAAVQQKQNELRQIKADLEAAAKSEEVRAEQNALEARAQAEQELQQIRGELEQLRLAADVTIPAEINRRVHELYAAGHAATIAADGEAMATALASVADAWRSSGGNAMDMYVLQNLEEIFGHVVSAAGQMEVGEVNLVDAGDGKTLPAYASAYPATVHSLLKQVQATLGIDINHVVTGQSNGTRKGLPGRQA